MRISKKKEKTFFLLNRFKFISETERGVLRGSEGEKSAQIEGKTKDSRDLEMKSEGFRGEGL